MYDRVSGSDLEASHHRFNTVWFNTVIIYTNLMKFSKHQKNVYVRINPSRSQFGRTKERLIHATSLTLSLCMDPNP